MEEKPKRAIDRAAWLIILVWLGLLQLLFVPGDLGLWGFVCPAVVVILIATWIGWFCGLLRGNAERGAFYGLASGLVVLTVLGVVVIIAVVQQGRF